METITIDRREHALKRVNDQRHFKLQLAIFVSVNTLLVVIFALATLAGAHVVSGQLWPWPSGPSPSGQLGWPPRATRPTTPTTRNDAGVRILRRQRVRNDENHR